MNEDDLVTAGFKRLDSKLIEKRPPKIKWGLLYQEMSDAKKITYLEKLASTMNHAAHLIQTERNALGELLEKKEKQLITLSHSVAANNAMLQQEITRMNGQRQGYNAEISKLRADLRTMNNGNLSKLAD